MGIKLGLVERLSVVFGFGGKDTKDTQLLKSILVTGTFGDIITKTFTNIQYVPIQRKSFEDVEILLSSDTGDPVPFERGKVVTTLHFRQHSYFT